MRQILLLVLIGVLPLAHAQFDTPGKDDSVVNEQLPKAVTSGFDAYSESNGEKAIYKWLGNSQKEGIWESKRSFIEALNRAESEFGAYTGYQFVNKVNLVTDFESGSGSSSMHREVNSGYAYEVSVKYERGAIGMRFNFSLQDRMQDFMFVHLGSPEGGPLSPLNRTMGPGHMLAVGVVPAGFAAYTAQGAEAAVAAWLKGSSVDNSVAEAVQAFKGAEDQYGKYTSFAVLPSPPIRANDPSSLGGEPKKVEYAIAYYERHEVYVAFTFGDENVIDSIQVDADASKIITDPKLAQRAEQMASAHYQQAGVIRGL